MKDPISSLFIEEANYLEDSLHNTVCDSCDVCPCDGEYSSIRCEFWNRHDNISATIDVVRAFLRLV